MQAGRRVFLVLDALNEADRFTDLVSAVDAFLPCLGKYPWLRLIISLRSGAYHGFDSAATVVKLDPIEELVSASVLMRELVSAEPHGADLLGNLSDSVCAVLHDAWKQHRSNVAGGEDLRTYLRKSFFEYHKKLYENRPTHFPLSSAKKSFVAFVAIHSWKDDTLNVLLADHLVPEIRATEMKRRERKAAKADREDVEPLLSNVEADEEEA
jgi:hypothetical protein